jgi:hypothetical protein
VPQLDEQNARKVLIAMKRAAILTGLLAALCAGLVARNVRWASIRPVPSGHGPERPAAAGPGPSMASCQVRGRASKADLVARRTTWSSLRVLAGMGPVTRSFSMPITIPSASRISTTGF